MNSRTTRTADSKPVRGSTCPVQKRPLTLSLAEPTKKVDDGVSLLVPVPPAHRRTHTIPCPMTPMTPGLDFDDGLESPESWQSSSASSTFTFDLLSPSTPHPDRGLSFTACPSSPLDESMVYAFPPRKRPASTGFPMRSRRLSADHSKLSVIFDSPLSEDPLKEGFSSPSDDRKYFHVRFLEEDSPFPKSPDC